MRHSIFIIVCLVLAIPYCHSQAPPTVTAGIRHGLNGRYEASFTVNNPPFNIDILAGRPYSAEDIMQHSQTLVDGTKTSRPGFSNILYRDSAGRARIERYLSSALKADAELPVIYEILDHVAGYLYYLDPAHRTAYRVVLPPDSIRILSAPPPQYYPQTPTVSKTADTRTLSEPLGTKMIEGVVAQGVRTTTTYPAGAMGNDRPVAISYENWRSQELNLTIYSKTTDPSSGETVRALINIRQAEPDPRLFQVPEGYKIADKTRPFEIRLSGLEK